MLTARHNSIASLRQVRKMLGVHVASAACIFLGALSLYAQAACFAEKTITAFQVRGTVSDPSGQPVGDARVWLSQNGEVVDDIKADKDGTFLLSPTPGTYSLYANASGFTTAFAHLKVKHGAIFSMSPRKVWLILGVGMHAPCPSAVTNDAEFRRLVDKFHYKLKEGSEEKNATQK